MFQGSKRVNMGSKSGKKTYLSIPNGPGSFLEKCVFYPFLTHFWPRSGPFSRHFGIFYGPKRATTGSKRAKKACLSIPSGLGTSLRKNDFFRPRGPRWTHRWPPTVRGPGYPPAPPSDHLYRGLCISLGESEAWKLPKVGGCVLTRCPRNSDLSHVAQDAARSWFWACLTQTAEIHAIFGHFWPFL